MKCYVMGYIKKQQPTCSGENLLFKLIESALSKRLTFVDSKSAANLILVMPYMDSSWFERKGLIRLLFHKKGQEKKTIQKIFGINNNQKILAISYENLDHRSWYGFGKILRLLDVPRLTFWPKQIDPSGCRFPYWWHYVDFKNYPLDDGVYERYGRPLSLTQLMRPINVDGVRKRKNAICALTNHLRWPRGEQLDFLREFIDVDSFRKGSELSWDGNKYDLLTSYKYNFAAENSIGYGYETEKLPEAWCSGAIPVGYFKNPFSDFNPNLNFSNVLLDHTSLLKHPLILTEPNLGEVISYIRSRIGS